MVNVISRVKVFVFCSLAIWMVGCSGGISRQVRSQVTYSGSFAALRENINRHVGETVILGGRIIAAEVSDEHSELVVLQLELDRSDRPVDGDRSEGRFLIRSRRFIDPAVYPSGTLVTVVGNVLGSEKRLIGRLSYRYPVVEPLELKKWRSGENQWPRFRLGVGVGTSF